MKDFTDLTLLLDASEGGHWHHEHLLKGVSHLIHAHQLIPTTRLSVITFGGGEPHGVIFDAVPVTDVDPSAITLQPHGGAPLYEALAMAIDRLGQRLHDLDEAERPTRVLLSTVTLGIDNLSVSISADDVRQRVVTQQHCYQWRFLYAAAQADIVEDAKKLGIPPGHALGFVPRPHGIKKVMEALTRRSLLIALGEDTFHDDERAESLAVGEDED